MATRRWILTSMKIRPVTPESDETLIKAVQLMFALRFVSVAYATNLKKINLMQHEYKKISLTLAGGFQAARNWPSSSVMTR